MIITNLSALKEALTTFCPTMEFVENTSHYRTWKDDHDGKLVGDWPLPDGWTAEMVGENALHIMRVKSEHRSAETYEIGIVPVLVKRDANGKVLEAIPNKAGKEYILMADWFAGGYGLLRQPGIGDRTVLKDVDGNKKESVFGDLYMYYRMMEAKQDAELQGDSIEFIAQEDGTYRAEVDTVARLGV